MNLLELRSYIRQSLGSPSVALLADPDITQEILGEVAVRQSEMIAAGKTLLSKKNYKTGTLSREGTINEKATGYIEVDEGVPATGLLGVISSVTEGETIAVNGTMFTFRFDLMTQPTATEVALATGDSVTVIAQKLAARLQSSTIPAVAQANYLQSGSNVVITSKTNSALGNAFTLANSSGGHVQRGSATLEGGGYVQPNETILVNGQSMTILRNATHPGTIHPWEISTLNSFTREQVATAIAEKLNISAYALIAESEYTADGTRVLVQARKPGIGGNEFALSGSSSNSLTVSGPRLTGGVTYSDSFDPPDSVRFWPNTDAIPSMLPIVNDIDALTDHERIGRRAILFYGPELNYQLSWDPADDEQLEFWWDCNISTLFEIATVGDRLPEQFGFAIAHSVAAKLVSRLMLAIPEQVDFYRLVQQNLAVEIGRWERIWTQFLYQSVSSSSTGQKRRHRGGRVVRPSRYPY